MDTHYKKESKFKPPLLPLQDHLDHFESLYYACFDMNYLNENLKLEIRKVFEPRYKRILTDNELIEIAENLSNVVEEICKFTWKQKYENQ